MKNKIIFLSIITFVCLLINTINVQAISFNLDITGNNTVEINKSVQLKAEYWVGNDMDNTGEISKENVTSKSTWTSSDSNIATVDKNGNVTGVSKGKATITARYTFENEEYREATYEITVVQSSNSYLKLGIILLSIIAVVVLGYLGYKKLKSAK